MRDDRVYVTHIRECIDRIERYVQEGRATFLTDEKTQDAVLRNLQTLAESTQRLSENLKAQHSEIDWRGIAGFRNMVVHNYLGIDPQQIWAIIEMDIPMLKATIERIYGSLPR